MTTPQPPYEELLWTMQNLAAEAAERAAAPLRARLAELDAVDDWANGVFCALHDVVQALVDIHPELASTLAAKWAPADQRFQALEAGGQHPDYHETQALLEARKKLYRLLVLYRKTAPIAPAPQAGSAAASRSADGTPPPAEPLG